jgi:hypothetical protein
MEFIEHSVAWRRGEIFEGRMMVLFGAVVTAVAAAFWRFGSTPAARTMFLPLLVVGALALVAGISMNFTNQSRIGAYRAAHAEDPVAFVRSERERTEAFIKWYPYTMFTFSFVALAGCAVFLWKPTPHGRAMGLALLTLSLGVLFIDHFSEERADGYHTQIMQALERQAVPSGS